MSINIHIRITDPQSCWKTDQTWIRIHNNKTVHSSTGNRKCVPTNFALMQNFYFLFGGGGEGGGGFCTWPPASWADLARLVSELDGLTQAQGLVHIPAQHTDTEYIHSWPLDLNKIQYSTTGPKITRKAS